jgi:hypothetical protein
MSAPADQPGFRWLKTTPRIRSAAPFRTPITERSPGSRTLIWISELSFPTAPSGTLPCAPSPAAPVRRCVASNTTMENQLFLREKPYFIHQFDR